MSDSPLELDGARWNTRVELCVVEVRDDEEWGAHRLYEIAITRNDVMDVALLLRALKIVGCGECQKCRGFGVWKARKGSGI